MHPVTLSFAAASAFALVVACAPRSMPEPPEGAAFFAENCTSCHGSDARGQGPASAGLTSKPTDLTLLARSNGGAFPTARALSYIWGAPDGGHLARVMPQFGAIMADDLIPLEVDGVQTPTPRALVGVLAYLESIQR